MLCASSSPCSQLSTSVVVHSRTLHVGVLQASSEIPPETLRGASHMSKHKINRGQTLAAGPSKGREAECWENFLQKVSKARIPLQHSSDVLYLPARTPGSLAMPLGAAASTTLVHFLLVLYRSSRLGRKVPLMSAPPYRAAVRVDLPHALCPARVPPRPPVRTSDQGTVKAPVIMRSPLRATAKASIHGHRG